jgi:hypothetical protein
MPRFARHECHLCSQHDLDPVVRVLPHRLHTWACLPWSAFLRFCHECSQQDAVFRWRTWPHRLHLCNLIPFRTRP